MSTPGLDVSGVLFKNLLNLELKSLIFSLGLALGLERSLIKVAVVWSSPNLVKDCSSNMSHIVMDPNGNEKYHEPLDPSKVYGNNLTTQPLQLINSY